MSKKATYMTGLAALFGLFTAVGEAQTAEVSLPPVETESEIESLPREMARIWACTELTEYLGGSRDVHVELTQPSALPEVGQIWIRVPDVRRNAWVTNEGLVVRWDWKDPRKPSAPLRALEDGFRYAFVVKPSGEGLYYDFELDGEGETAPPREKYTCRRASFVPGNRR